MNNIKSSRTIVTTPAAPRPPSQVSNGFAALFDELDIFDKALDAHRERLDPVLAVQVPHAATEDISAEPPDNVVCSVADRLRFATSRINALRISLEHLTERTEA